MKWINDNRKRLMLVGFVAAILLRGRDAKADFIWTQKADIPTPRIAHTSAVVNGKIYVIGGSTSEPNAKALSTVEEYDPVTNTWTRKADMPTIRTDMVGSSAVVDGKIYIIGGYNGGHSWGSPTVEEYDTLTDTWTQKADMPTPRWSLATCAVDGKIYAIGGAPNSITGLNVVEQYDPTTDMWTRKANMPTGVWGLCACVVNGKIYAVGGRPGYTAIPNVQEYDPATDSWTRKSNMPVGTSQMATAVVGDKIIAIGGWRSSGNSPYKAVQIYDPETDTWTREADTPFLRAWCSASVVNDRIYVIGGTDRPHPCPATSTVYESGPQLDFNYDGIVDSDDTRMMLDHWHTDEPLCDIVPLPWGDGIVDAHDLIFLAQYLLSEDVSLVAHWKLEEIEGIAAHNSINCKDGTLNGNPIWLPAGGMIGGTLLFDGVDDYVETPFILNPANGSFSVFAWIKGAPGQVIISQIGDFGETWLGIKSPGGELLTGFCDTYFDPLESEAVITDGQWHHVGLVYDLDVFHRRLYVDGILVAEDTTPVAGNPSDDGLHIGASKELEAGSFFSGLIDDVRIYNAALSTEEIEALAQ